MSLLGCFSQRHETLKLISEKYIGDQSARLRFLREARAAAKVRHSNVASVFHLGRTGENYFYAMEFVEGETLEKLIRCSGRLDCSLAELLDQLSTHTSKLEVILSSPDAVTRGFELCRQ